MEITNKMIEAAAEALAPFWPQSPSVQIKARAQIALEAAGKAYDDEVPTMARTLAERT